VSLILAIFRRAEFGFFGVVVLTSVQTPRLKGEGKETGRFFLVLKAKESAGALDLARAFLRGFLINCPIRGIDFRVY